MQTELLHHLGASCLTIDVLAQDLGLTNRQVSNAAAGLIEKNLLERVEAGCFQLTVQGRNAAQSGVQITSGPNGPLQSVRKPEALTLRQRAWNAIRIQRRFTVPDLLTAAAMGDEKSAANNLQRWLGYLCRARIVRRLPRRQPGTAPTSPGYVQYTLVNDLGHIAPTYRAKSRAIFDHNSGEEIRCE